MLTGMRVSCSPGGRVFQRAGRKSEVRDAFGPGCYPKASWYGKSFCLRPIVRRGVLGAYPSSLIAFSHPPSAEDADHAGEERFAVGVEGSLMRRLSPGSG